MTGDGETLTGLLKNKLRKLSEIMSFDEMPNALDLPETFIFISRYRTVPRITETKLVRFHSACYINFDSSICLHNLNSDTIASRHSKWKFVP